ncbi:MAG: sulfatase-like hydrolase/transferase, partial [Clostridiaceae bacterium]|nr:sulfatase-like hydrolase/transferase [Clostridiaceae bacterium]
LLVNTSLYPAEEGAAFVRFAENKYYSLPQALNSIGYNTYSLHAFTSKFWNRTEMYKALGFGKFIDDSYYVMDDFAGWEGDALSDASFFRQSLDLIDISEPFYAFFITLSSHYPFTYFEESYNFNVGELEGTFIGNYIKAARYADECLGQFIDQLKDKGLFDDSLLVVYGDHSGVPRHLSDELVSFVNVEFSDAEWVKLQKVPLIIHYPGFKNGETISTIGGQIDILPTIANLMDFEVPYALGKDLLNTKTGYAVLRNGTVITDKYIYIAELNEMYSAIDNKIIRSGKYEKDAKLLLNQLKVSDLILEKDALRIISNNGTSE